MSERGRSEKRKCFGWSGEESNERRGSIKDSNERKGELRREQGE